MLNDRFSKPSQPGAQAPERWPPEELEAAWEHVLDCGAPGPGRNAPALFYQAGQPSAEAVLRRDPGQEADHARAS